eukprot:7338919-Pyramimonas_sp.AAC.1
MVYAVLCNTCGVNYLMTAQRDVVQATSCTRYGARCTWRPRRSHEQARAPTKRNLGKPTKRRGRPRGAHMRA